MTFLVQRHFSELLPKFEKGLMFYQQNHTYSILTSHLCHTTLTFIVFKHLSVRLSGVTYKSNPKIKTKKTFFPDHKLKPSTI